MTGITQGEETGITCSMVKTTSAKGLPESNPLTLSQTTNFELCQTERVCR